DYYCLIWHNNSWLF
nr:immunoglobulin light chain junction region [Macaca mulatta]MOX77858.1 immunoglobulin light chain junction region [Macaca mulatta]MOX78354.1 immunoglobulin light chain junction region [Macaca mulatta]MOX78417.1 immunoglobulin light chain junction region [Macaca mulatta]MOX78944.1 immunoglobulin light chain junction region [Macaca mulatta]